MFLGSPETFWPNYTTIMSSEDNISMILGSPTMEYPYDPNTYCKWNFKVGKDIKASNRNNIHNFFSTNFEQLSESRIGKLKNFAGPG
jgi:hypothetical protein